MPLKYDEDCYLCLGNARSGDVVNPDYDDVFIFDSDFPMLLCDSAPVPGGASDEWQLHDHTYAPVLRSATNPKYMIGFELLAKKHRNTTAESAAKRLRKPPID